MSDYISSLPDDILLKILERLKTDEAVRMCMLAMRWINLWTSLSILDIRFRDSTAKSTIEEIISLLHKIKNVRILNIFPRCHLRRDLLPQELPEIQPRFENLRVLTVALCFYSYLEIQYWIVESCPKLTKLVQVQHQSCLCDNDYGEWEKTVVSIPMVEASGRRDLQRVEVKFWRFDTMVKRAIQYLMLGKGELRNFRHYALVVTHRIPRDPNNWGLCCIHLSTVVSYMEAAWQFSSMMFDLYCPDNGFVMKSIELYL